MGRQVRFFRGSAAEAAQLVPVRPAKGLAHPDNIYTLVHIPMKAFMHQRDFDGCPNYVRAWVCKAGKGTLQRGYRDVGYLLAPHVSDFQPPVFTASRWRQAVSRLHELCIAGEGAGVLAWCREAYPSLVQLVPESSRGEFAAGLVERTREEVG